LRAFDLLVSPVPLPFEPDSSVFFFRFLIFCVSRRTSVEDLMLPVPSPVVGRPLFRGGSLVRSRGGVGLLGVGGGGFFPSQFGGCGHEIPTLPGLIVPVGSSPFFCPKKCIRLWPAVCNSSQLFFGLPFFPFYRSTCRASKFPFFFGKSILQCWR